MWCLPIRRNRKVISSSISDSGSISIERCARKIMSIYINMGIISLITTTRRFELATIDRDRLVNGEDINEIICDRLDDCGII